MHLPLTTGGRGHAPGRRLVAATVAAPVLFLVTASAGGGWSGAQGAWVLLIGLTAVVGAAILATYVPLAGQSLRDAVGCSPCAAMSALAVGGAIFLVATRPHDVAMAALGLAVLGLALVRRQDTSDQACPARGQRTPA